MLTLDKLDVYKRQHMDSEGHRAVGWYQEGDYMFYFNEGGELQRNTTTPDGHTVNENGVMIS